MDGARQGASPDERRLHPWSWLFVLLQQLKQFIFPLVALVVFGARRSSGDGELWASLAPIIGITVLVVLAILQYFTYRYTIGRDGLTVREGLLHRSRREIPFSRIHNVVVHQSLLHRVFGVAEVRLESAGGTKPEAQMRVLGLHDALALEDLVRHQAHGTAPVAPGQEAAPRDEGTTLLSLSTMEVLRLGLISNRGMIVVAADEGAKIAKSYDATMTMKPDLSSRTSYVIGKDGKVVFAFDSMNPNLHVRETLAAVTALKAKPAGK